MWLGGKRTRAGVLQAEVLVSELGAVDALAASAVVVGKVAALAHEVGDNAVEARPLEAEALLPCAQRAKVLRRLRDDVSPQLQEWQHNLIKGIGAEQTVVLA